MINPALFSSAKSDWETPPELFKQLNEEFHFTLDVCATAHNTKVCANYYNEETNGLTQNWAGHMCWCNPPYGKTIGLWVKKAYEESMRGAKVVCLLPARTDTRWFHNWVYRKTWDLVFLPGRIKFVGAKHSAPFPSMLAIYGADH